MEVATILTPQYRNVPDCIKYFQDIPGMTPMEIGLPDPPNLSDIRNYNLPTSDQMWRRTPMPDKLKKLSYEFALKEAAKPKSQRGTGGGHSDLFTHMMINKKLYEEEWEFIDEQFRLKDEGMWFYNHGKVQHITGNHWFYTHEWNMSKDDGGSGHPDFYVKDSNYWHFQQAALLDPNCCGMGELTRRRDGKSYRAGCAAYYNTSFNYGKFAGFQSKTKDDAQEMFHKTVVEAWKKLPFYFQCIFNNSSDPKMKLSFYAPVIKGADVIAQMVTTISLESWMEARSSDKSAFDGAKLHFGVLDEVGKTKEKECDIYDRSHTIKKCLQDGPRFIGFDIHTSTVEDMVKDGGANYKKFWDDSDWGKKNILGQTKSGRWRYFLPAYDGYVVNKYGESDMEEGRRLLQIERDDYADDPEELVKIIRKNPFTPAEAFRIGGGGCPFNAIIIHTRMEQLERWKDATKPGNFEWLNDEPGGVQIGDPQKIFRPGKVVWQPSKAGEFNCSYLFSDPKEANRQFSDDGLIVPGNTELFIGGGDPYAYRKTLLKKRSDGGGVIYMKWNPAIDNPHKDIADWETARFIIDYSDRPRTPEIYCEYMLKMCIYYGCQMFPEINVPMLWDYFIDRGYGGFLQYRIDPKTGKFLKTPGARTNEEIGEAIFQSFRTQIERHGMRERHWNILDQCLEIESPDQMTMFDLFTAGGYSLLGNKKPILQEEKESINLENYHPMFVIKAGETIRVI